METTVEQVARTRRQDSRDQATAEAQAVKMSYRQRQHQRRLENLDAHESNLLHLEGVYEQRLDYCREQRERVRKLRAKIEWDHG